MYSDSTTEGMLKDIVIHFHLIKENISIAKIGHCLTYLKHNETKFVISKKKENTLLIIKTIRRHSKWKTAKL